MTKRILFVDDEPNVLHGLKRMLRGMRSEWEMHYSESGYDALERMGKRVFDVIISDMRMPGMNGAQLLTEVMNRHPHVVRIILSGQSRREMIFKSVGPTHQYLSKPCDAQTLKLTVQRACALRDRMGNGSITKLVSRIKSLPSLPSLYTEITAELRSPSGTIGRVGEIISKDVSMAAKILQMVNSAYFGMPHHVSSPSQAASLLGLDTLRTLVLSVHIFSGFKHSGQKGFSIENLWEHSLNTGLFAREITKAELNDIKAIDDAFMAGVLHDVGKLIIATELTGDYEKIVSLMETEMISMYEAEQRLLGVSHADIGAYLLGLWGLPDPIVEAVCYHHSPSKQPGNKFTPLTAVHVADCIEHELDGTKNSFTLDKDHLRTLTIAEQLEAWKEICRESAQGMEESELQDTLR